MGRSVIGSLHQDAKQTLILWYVTGQKTVEQMAGELYGTQAPTRAQINSVKRLVVREPVDSAELGTRWTRREK